MSDTLQAYENLESDNPDARRSGMQSLIDSGAAWQLEGSIGRTCMDAIEAGLCAVGKVERWDFFGNHIPSRDMLIPGTPGTVEYMTERGYSLPD